MRERKWLRWSGLVLLVSLAGGSAASLAAQERAETHTFLFGPGENSWLGVEVADVTPEKAQELKLPGDYGAIVMSVEPNSPAAKADLQKNDAILQFAGERVRSVAELTRLVRETPPGRTVEVEIRRNGTSRNLQIKIEKAEAHAFEFNKQPFVFNDQMPMTAGGPRIEVAPFSFRIFNPRAVLGISGDDLTSQLAGYFGVREGKGILVREVTAGSAADRAGLKAGDVIVKVGSKEVATVEALRDALEGGPNEERKVQLTVVRNRQEQTVTVQLEPAQRREVRSATALKGLGPDRQEIEQLAKQAQEIAAEYSSKAGEYQKTMEQMQRQLKRELGPLKENLQREMNQYKLQMRDEIKRQIELQKDLKGSDVV